MTPLGQCELTVPSPASLCVYQVCVPDGVLVFWASGDCRNRSNGTCEGCWVTGGSWQRPAVDWSAATEHSRSDPRCEPEQHIQNINPTLTVSA